ncbi:MAG TPA: anti-sigma F factor [Firmicutes bacterium]|nr:anti-sigma F factor [Bacillota bacterium]
MKINNYFSLEIPSKSVNESFARVVVAAFAAQLDPTLEELNDVKTAVSEAVTNAIIHGYAETGEKGIIYIKAELKDNGIIIEVEDKGVGIANLQKAMEPLYTSKPELERSGMGFTIMENFMDKVEVDTEVGRGTRVVLAKKFSSRQEE